MQRFKRSTLLTLLTLITLITLITALLLAPPAAQAQPVFQSLTTNTVITLTNSQTLTWNSPSFYVRMNQGVAVVPWFVGTSNTTAAITFTFDVSCDSTNYTTLTPFTYAPALNASTAVIGYTNWDKAILNNVRKMRLRSIANADTNTVFLTNLWIGYWP